MTSSWSANGTNFLLHENSGIKFFVNMKEGEAGATYCVSINNSDLIPLVRLDSSAILGIPNLSSINTCHDSVFSSINVRIQYINVDREEHKKLVNKERVKLALMTFWRTTCVHTTDNIALHPNILYAFGHEFWKKNVYPGPNPE